FTVLILSLEIDKTSKSGVCNHPSLASTLQVNGGARAPLPTNTVNFRPISRDLSIVEIHPKRSRLNPQVRPPAVEGNGLHRPKGGARAAAGRGWGGGGGQEGLGMRQKGVQHEDFPGGHPSQYYSRPSTLNFGVLMGSGALVLV